MPHLLGEMFKQKANVDMVHVPYQGNSPATVAAAAGDVQLTFDTLLSARPFIDSGKLRALGVAALRPIDGLPDVPTIASVLPDFTGESWPCRIRRPQCHRPRSVDCVNSLIRPFSSRNSSKMPPSAGSPSRV